MLVAPACRNKSGACAGWTLDRHPPPMIVSWAACICRADSSKDIPPPPVPSPWTARVSIRPRPARLKSRTAANAARIARKGWVVPDRSSPGTRIVWGDDEEREAAGSHHDDDRRPAGSSP